MMNPTFNILKDQYLQEELCTEYLVTLREHRFEDTNMPYMLINLNLGDDKQFKINGRQLTLTNHHFTIPKDKDSKTKSFYHYSMFLQDDKSKQHYRVHVYFGKRDDITVEPKLFIQETTGKFTFATELDAQAQQRIYHFALSQTALIMFLRAKQKESITALSHEVQDNEEKLVEFSKDLVGNRKAYITLATTQMKIITALNHIGCQTYMPAILGYKRMLNFLNNLKKKESVPPITAPRPALKTSAATEKAQTSETKENEVASKNHASATLKKKKRKKKKPAAKGNSVSSKEMTTTIIESKNLIALFDKTQPITNIDPAHIKAMIENLRACQLCYSEENPNSLANFLELKSELTKRLMNFFDSCDLQIYGNLAVFAVTTNLLALKDSLISEIVKNDNAEMLNELIKADLINEATKYQCSNDKKSYTIIELCVLSNSTRCFAALLNNGYSLGYIDDPNSPLFEVIEDPTAHPEINETCLKLKANAYHELLSKSLSFYKDKRNKVSGDELTLIDIKLDLIICIERIRKILNECPVLQSRISLDKLNVFSSNLSILLQKHNIQGAAEFNQQLKTHVKYQRAYLRQCEELYKLLYILKSNTKFKNMLRKEEVNLASLSMLEKFIRMPIDICAEFIIEQVDLRTESMMVAREALEEKCLVSVTQQGLLEFKKTATGKQLVEESNKVAQRMKLAELTFKEAVDNFEESNSDNLVDDLLGCTSKLLTTSYLKRGMKKLSLKEKEKPEMPTSGIELRKSR